jgi:translocation and assembly module TamB
VSLGLRGPLTLAGEAHGDPRRPDAARATARVEAPHVQASGALARLGPAAVSGEVSLVDGIIEVKHARGRWAAGDLDVTGRVQTRGLLALRTTVSADLARVAGAWGVAGLSGAATVDAEIAGPWDAPTARGVAQTPDLAVAGARLQAVRLPFAVTPRTLRLDGATAGIGQTAVRLDGTARWTAPGPLEVARWREAISVDASLAAARARVADLAPWLPADWPAAGDFSLVARLGGTPGSWRGTGRIEAERLHVRGQMLQQVRADFALTPDGVHVRPLALQAWGASIAGEVSWRWQGTGAAGLDVGPISLAAVPGVPEGLALAGTARARVDVRLATDGLAGDATVTAQGVTAAGLTLGDGSARATVRDGLLTADLAFPASRLSATARGRLQQGQSLTIHARGDDLDAGMLAARALPAHTGQVDGRLSVVAELAVPYGRPAEAEGTLRVEPLRVTWAGEEWVAQGPVLVRRRAATTTLERLQLESGLGTFTAGGTVSDDGTLALTARGRLPLTVLPAFRREVRAASGVLEATVRLGGSVQQPEILGEGQVSNGQLTLADYPDTLREVRARFTMSPRAVRVSEAAASLGGGQLTASGEMAIEAARPGAYRFTITARKVATAPIADLAATWDADLELVGFAERAQLRGEARLQRALYTRDISILRTVLAGGPAREGQAGAGTGLHLDLRVALQDNLVVRTSIARFRAGGTLTVAGTTSAPVVFGTVETREGQIVFRRQTFTLTSASARFVDPRRIDPVLDVRGTAQIRGYDVTLHISGRAEDLEIRFASSPPLPEEDVLGLVAFGATREQIGRSGPGLVAGEVAGLLVQDLFGVQPGQAGVDVLEVETDPEVGTRTLRVGKQLTPRTLVIFSQNIDDTEARHLRLEYQVFGPLRVAGEQDFLGGFGGDVLVRLRFR